MQRPNLAARPFLDSRPVIVTGVALAVVAVALTVLSVANYLSERGQATQLAAAVRDLDSQASRLSAEVATLDRQLAVAPWKKLRAETASMQRLVVQRTAMWTTLFADLERVMPWDTRLLSITPQAGEDGEIMVALTGVAADRSAWLKLLGRLFSDPRFSDPTPRSEESPGEQNAVGFKFTLMVRYWPAGRS
jgi:outer membrane murein-binding lipoprotein Lpp